MSSRCPPVKKNKDKNEFEPGCATDVFQTYYTNWDKRTENYLDHINDINDPILKYISLYFVQYYIDGYDYYKNSENSERDGACQYLKKWLHKQRDLFTYGEKCKKREKLWEKNFSTLWSKLKSEYRIPEKEKTNPWCDSYKYAYITKFSNDVTLPSSCHENISLEPNSADSCPQPVITKCDCSKCEVPMISSLPVQPSETLQTTETDQPPQTDRTKNLAVTSGFTAVGTLGTLFFLYRFTPMASWFRRPGMNNIGPDLYMDSGSPGGFLGMPHGNDSNNIFYQSSV